MEFPVSAPCVVLLWLHLTFPMIFSLQTPTHALQSGSSFFPPSWYRLLHFVYPLIIIVLPVVWPFLHIVSRCARGFPPLFFSFPFCLCLSGSLLSSLPDCIFVPQPPKFLKLFTRTICTPGSPPPRPASLFYHSFVFSHHLWQRVRITVLVGGNVPWSTSFC